MENERSRERVASAAAVAVFHLLLGYAFLTGLGFDPARQTAETMRLFDVGAEPPPPPSPKPPPPAVRSDAPEAAAAPPALKAQASPVVAPTPEVRLPVPPALVAVPKPGTGSDTSQGASDRPGPGTGSGGQGSGTGSGGSGSGSGVGGIAQRSRQVAGELTGRDYPRAAKRARAGGTVLIRYAVGTDGRVSGCTITQSSGNAELDSATCQLVQQRFRYEPARDAQGRAVEEVVNGRHIWWTEPRRRRYPYDWQPPEEGQEP